MLVNFKRLKGWDFFFVSFFFVVFVLFFLFFFFEGGGLFQTMGLHGGGERGLSLEKSYIMMGWEFSQTKVCDHLSGMFTFLVFVFSLTFLFIIITIILFF